MEKHERLRMAVDYLIRNRIISHKRELSIKLERRPETVSRSLNGKNGNPTNDFLRDFNHAFNDVFNISWLINEDGNMLAPQKTAQESTKNIEPINVSEKLLSQLVSQNTALIELLKAKEASMEKVMGELAEIKKELNEISSKIKATPYEIGISTIQSVLNEDKGKVYLAKKKEKQG